MEFLASPLSLLSWSLVPGSDFLELDASIIYYFGLGPQHPNEPEYCIFSITLDHIFRNKNTGEIILNAKANKTYKINNNNQSPTVAYLFEFLNTANIEYTLLFKERLKEINLATEEVPPLSLSNYQSKIEECIQVWEAHKK